MNWNSKQSAAERGAAIAAATCLGAAAGFGIFALAPVAGLALTGAAMLGGGAAGGIAWVMLGRVNEARGQPTFGFEPVDFPGGELGELLLDDAVVRPAPDSRVVQLFGDQPLPEPGELALRIDDYLDEGRGASRRGGEGARPDASAALHAALAEIRRSLG